MSNIGASTSRSKSSDSDVTGVVPIDSAIQDKESSSREDKNRSKYLPLLKAVIRGDWEKTQAFLNLHPDALTAEIATKSKTPLHVAVGRGAAIEYVKNLMGKMSPEQLEDVKISVLIEAAIVGNVAAAKLLVGENARLPLIRDSNNYMPINWAAYYGHRDMVLYLLDITKHVEPSPYKGEVGLHLLNHIIFDEFYDIGLNFVQNFPDLAIWESTPLQKTTLLVLAGKPSAFPSGVQYSIWQQIIYYYVPLKSKQFSSYRRGDIENGLDIFQENKQNLCCMQLFKGWLKAIVWEFVERIVPPMKHIRQKKFMHHQSLQLVKHLCKEVQGLKFSEYSIIFRDALFAAAENGIHEIIEEVLESVPFLVWSWDDQRRSIFSKAILNRNENVFNLLYQMSDYKHIPIEQRDKDGNNILHLAGKLAPPHKLNRITGAALQMQRELQWYKEVEKFVQPYAKKELNNGNKTPAMVFTEEHEDLVNQGENWLKSTANSCTIAAALIATVVFAAAITVPGGYRSDNGLPFLSHEMAFIIFAVSDTISLFSSTAAVLMFLSILTARCAENDFLYALPKRLILGQVTLFLSITSMMIAFSAVIYLLFGKNQPHILILVCISACLPVTLFVTLQFPLLVTMIKSTYGPSIFGKKSECQLY